MIVRPNVLMLAGAGILAALVIAGRNAGATGRAIGGAAVDAVDGVVSGVVIGIGEGVGIPQTNEAECERAIREGRTWDASFVCPAKRFLSYLWS